MNIKDLALQENVAMGPMAESGGVIHKIDEDTAILVADAIAAASGSWCVPVVILCAFVRGESNFDPAAENPNLEDAPNHEWPDAATLAAHSDYGLCQINGNASYLGVGAVKQSLDYLCAEIITNVMWATVNDYPPEVAYEAYNKGRSGAEAIYKLGGVAACEYGHIVQERVQEYVKMGVA